MTNNSLRRLAIGLVGLVMAALLAACGDSATSTPSRATITTTSATTATTITSAATTNATTSTSAAATTTTAAGSNTGWSLAAAAAPYKGQKVTLATVAWKDATIELAKDFTQQTGINLEVIQLPNSDLLQKTLLDARTKTGAYDLFAHSPMTPFAKPGYILPLDEYLKNPSLADPTYNLSDAVNADFYTKYGGKTLALPFGASSLALFYRKDLFENEQYKADFKAKYGYDLKPPTDWKQFLDISKFFTETDWKGPGGEKGYGFAAYGKREFSMTYIFQLFNGSMISLKGNSKTGLVDDKFQPTFNNETGQAALELWKQTLQYAPPGVMQDGNTETRDLFAKGLTAMTITFDSALGTILTSPVKDKWAIAPLPGRTVLGGWTLSVNIVSKNKEAAFLAAQYLTNARSDSYLFDKAGRYPARASTYASELYKAKNPYGEVLSKAKNEAVPQIDVENVQVDNLFSEQISLYLNNQKDAKTTLQDMSSDLTKILKDGGWLAH